MDALFPLFLCVCVCPFIVGLFVCLLFCIFSGLLILFNTLTYNMQAFVCAYGSFRFIFFIPRTVKFKRCMISFVYFMSCFAFIRKS